MVLIDNRKLIVIYLFKYLILIFLEKGTNPI